MILNITKGVKEQIRVDKVVFTTLISIIFDSSMYVSLIVYALYINRYMGVMQTAFIVAIPNLISFLAGPFPYMLIKKIGRKMSLIIGMAAMAISYYSIAISTMLISFLIVSVTIGISQLILKPILRSLFSESAINDNGIDLVHRIRYISICISGILGPLVGGFVSQKYGYQICFKISAIGFFLCILLVILRGHVLNYNTTNSNEDIGKKERGIFSLDKKQICLLCSCILSGLLVYTVFIQFETVYSLTLKELFKNPASLYSKLIALNSFFGMTLQILIMLSKSKFRVKLKVKFGLIMFQLAFAIFALIFYFKYASIVILVIAVLIYSIGEVIVIPGLDISIDKIAPKDKKSLYFGFAEFRVLGFSLGPIIMGVILKYSNAVFLNIINIIFLLLALTIEFWFEKYSNKD